MKFRNELAGIGSVPEDPGPKTHLSSEAQLLGMSDSEVWREYSVGDSKGQAHSRVGEDNSLRTMGQWERGHINGAPKRGAIPSDLSGSRPTRAEFVKRTCSVQLVSRPPRSPSSLRRCTQSYSI